MRFRRTLLSRVDTTLGGNKVGIKKNSNQKASAIGTIQKIIVSMKKNVKYRQIVRINFCKGHKQQVVRVGGLHKTIEIRISAFRTLKSSFGASMWECIDNVKKKELSRIMTQKQKDDA